MLTLVFAAAVLQSTLLAGVALYGAVPDLALGILVYLAYAKGLMAGQVSGFLSGVLLDLISAAPIGLNALIRTLIGAAASMTKGRVLMGYILLPVLLCALATLLKAALLFPLSLIFPEVSAYPLSAPLLWAELALNMASAPPLFLLLKRLDVLMLGRRHRDER